MWSIDVRSLHIFCWEYEKTKVWFRNCKYEDRFHDWTGSVCLRNARSLKSMLSRWLLVPTGSAIVFPSYSCFKRNNQRLFHNEQCSRKHCRKRGVAHVPRWKCFTIPAITITAAKYYTPVCVSAGWKTTIWLHHPCHSHSTLLSSMWCHIPFLQPWASHSLLLLNYWRAFIVSILIPFLCNSDETGVKTGVECTLASYLSFTSPHLIIIK